MRYADHWPQLAKYWDAMVIVPSRLHEFQTARDHAMAHKDLYQKVEAATKLPWAMAAAIHWRESTGNFNTYFGNGQSLLMRTTIVPYGRGPFTKKLPDLDAFVAGAIDAVNQEGWGSILDWRLEKQLYYEEAFNGPGYYLHGVPSPYLFGGTSVQRPGKYVHDGVWVSNFEDPQIGTAGIMQTIAAADPSIVFVRETAS